MNRTHRKRRSFWIDITFSLAIITLTVAAIYLISFNAKNEAASPLEKKKSTAKTPFVVDTTDSNYPGIKIITETSNDTFSPFAIQYPQSIHNQFNEEISAYIKKAKQNYLSKMEENRQLGSEFKGELNISFETLYHHSGNYSFVLINSSSTGGANGSTEIRSFHLHPDSGKVITVEEIFSNDLSNLEQITTLVRDKLVNDPAVKNLLFQENMQIKTEPIWENYRNLAITDDSLIFYFEESTIAAGAAGPPIIAISLQDISELLADEFKLQKNTPSEEIVDDSVVENKEEDDNRDSDKPNLPTDSDDKTDEDSEVETATNSEDTRVKKVALTFDDGPDPKVTMQILETLEKYNAKATFFMLGSRVEYYPEIAKHVADAGHELGNHTWNHPDLTKASVKKIRDEINGTSSIIENVTGMQPTVFRPPYGAVNKTVRGETNLPVILWDVDTLDWKHRDPNQLFSTVKSSTKDGDIILMHDVHQSTAEGLDAVLAYLQSEGFTFVKISELN